VPISSSTRLGPYEILAPLGAGGMGEVYRARDPRLAREVAIKVLRADAVHGAEWRRRFETEARAASSLNHPNILTVYDIGEESGAPYLVTELVDGESLRAALGGGSLPTRKLLEVAVQIADGLAAAHQAGITHRDLKPENIMITRDGRVKILDFGLAKPAPSSQKGDETETLPQLRTGPGVILGTVAYMSPEQARGRPVDFRSDQFSFGSILYEMATAKRPFQEEDTVATLSAIVRDEPVSIVAQNPQTPAPLRWIIDRCLAKEASQRYASTADLHQQLRDLRDHLAEVVSSERLIPPAAAPSQKRRFLPAVLVLLGLLAGFFLAASLPPPGEQGLSAYRFTPFATEAMDEIGPVWSPDGQALAYLGRVDGVNQIFTRSLSSAVPVQITKSSAPCSSPFWSPDGTRIYYLSQGSLWSVGATGGAPQLVAKGAHASPTVSPDGKTFAFFRYTGSRAGLWTCSASGGNLQEYKQAPFPESLRFGHALQFSPDAKKIIGLLVDQIGEGGADFWIFPYPAGKPRRIPIQLPRSVRTTGFSWMPNNRHVVFAAELGEGSGSHLYSLDTETSAVRAITASAGEEQDPSVSPDGQRIAFASGGSDWDLVEGFVDRPATSVLLATSRQEHSPAWAPSGRQYAYVSDAGGIPEIWLRSPAEGWARPVVVGHAEGFLGRSAPRFSPDGQRIAYWRTGLKHLVWISNVAGGREVPLEQESTDQHAPAWSPDGNWIAYARFVAGNWEIAKAPSGGGSQPVRLGEGGESGVIVEWSPSGEWICFGDGSGLHLVSPDGKAQRLLRKIRPPAFGFSKDGSKVYLIRRPSNQGWELAAISVRNGEERKITDLNLPPDAQVAGFSLHPDGQRFATSTGTTKRDIWILEGFQRSPGWFSWLRPGR